MTPSEDRLSNTTISMRWKIFSVAEAILSNAFAILSNSCTSPSAPESEVTRFAELAGSLMSLSQNLHTIAKGNRLFLPQ
jgi:hypothetical protein